MFRRLASTMAKADIFKPERDLHLPEIVHASLPKTLTEGRRLLLVGDVHGCALELNDLLGEVKYDRNNDVVVFVGDLVAKGPYSKEVLDIARSMPRVYGVRGNHDHYVIMHQTKDSHPDSEHMKLARDDLGDDNLAWLEKLPFTLHIEQYDVLVVHAGIVPGCSVQSNSVDNMIHMRNVLPDGTATSKANEGVPWLDDYEGPSHCVFGHDAVRGLQVHPRATGLDTGCVYGNMLSCLMIPQWEIAQVPAREIYVAPLKPMREQSDDDVPAAVSA